MDNKKKNAAIAFYPTLIRHELSGATSLVKGLKDLEKTFEIRAKSNMNPFSSTITHIPKDTSKNLDKMWGRYS